MGKDYKQFDFNSKDDYLFVFYQLISRSYQLLRRFKKYESDLEKYVLSLEKDNVEYIDDEIHSEWHDKILSVTRGLITVYVDDVKGGLSYVKIRRILGKTEYKLEPLGEEIQKELDELRDVRNWSYHLPQTDLVAMKEVFYKSIPKEWHQFVEYNFNPIKIGITKKCSTSIMVSLFLHTERRKAVFEEIFKCMINDFESLLGEKVSIIEVQEKPLELLGDNLSTSQLSMAMNRRKYDGSDESFEKITFQKSYGTE